MLFEFYLDFDDLGLDMVPIYGVMQNPSAEKVRTGMNTGEYPSLHCF